MIDEVMNSEVESDGDISNHIELRDYTNQNFLDLIEAKN
jgi:hypothetical protein